MIAAWLIAVALMLTLVHTFGANTSNNLELPGTNSQNATDLLASEFPPQQNGKNPIVFHTKSGKVTDSENKQAIEQSFKNMKALPHTYSATSPFTQQGQAEVSKDKQTAYIPVLLDIGSEELTDPIAQSYLKAAEPARKAGMEVAAGASIGSELSEPETESSEVVGMVAAMIILAFTFGTLIAMGMPILSAVFGLAVGLSFIGLLGHVTEVPQIAPTLAIMIGLGVGIDYALFLVSRYRTERAEGADTHEAIATATATSGTAIVFAGGTVVIALVSLLVAGIPLVTSLGYSSAFAVVTAVFAAITFLPAVLSAVGDHIDSFRLPAFLRPKPKPASRGFWGAWARFVTNHPYAAVALMFAILIPLIIPFFSLNLGQEDIGATPKDTTERQAYDLMAAGFGRGYNGPLLVAVDMGDIPATPGTTFEKQYKRAQNLQDQLEEEQAYGETQATSLQNQANDLEAQQAILEAEKATLESKATNLKGEKAQLTTSAKKLKKQKKILQQADALVGEAAGLLRTASALAKDAQQIAAELQQNPSRELVQQLKQVQALLKQVKDEAAGLKSQFTELKKKASRVGGEAFDLAQSAAAAAKQAVALVQQKNQLIQEANGLKVQAAQLQTQKAQLQALQQQATTQQQQAEKLKTTLTADLTAAGGDNRGTDPRLVNLQDGLSATMDVQLVAPPDINKSGDAAVFTVIAKGDPADPETADLVRTIRSYVIPQYTQGSGLTVYVGGQTASYVDLASAITSKLGLVIFTVVGLGFLVLMTAFRSVLIPAQAALANVLSVCAAFGVITAVFQFGWGISLVGLDTDSGTDPIASYVPLFMFTVLFGLSMDYQVFLMSQIEQHRAKVRGDRRAVQAGLATGARVISAAALIMISVFGSFILDGDPTVKQFGVGLSVGVALAATSVLLLAPALLVLAGKGVWWVPRWADRVLPHLDIEGAKLAEADKKGPTGKQPAPRKPRPDSMKL